MACVAAGLMTSRPTKHAAMHLYCTAGPIEEDALLLAGLLQMQAGLQPCRDWQHTHWAVQSCSPLCTETPQPFVALCRRHAWRQTLLVAPHRHSVLLPDEEAHFTKSRAAQQEADLMEGCHGRALTSPALVSWTHDGFSLSIPDAGLELLLSG